jgi:type IV secretory pathway VirB2 component (pilin)
VACWHVALTLVVLVAGIVWSVARRVRRRTGWPVALVTLLGVLGVFAGAVVALQVASGGNLFP